MKQSVVCQYREAHLILQKNVIVQYNFVAKNDKKIGNYNSKNSIDLKCHLYVSIGVENSLVIF